MRLIDGDALIDHLRKDPLFHFVEQYGITGVIEAAPTIDAVPVKCAKLVNPNPFGECSICGYLIDVREEYRYCPMCGAKMERSE